MAQGISIKATGDPAALLAKYDAVIRKQGQVIRTLDQASRKAQAGGTAARQMGRDFRDGGELARLAIRGITGALGVTGVLGAMQKVTEEIRTQIRLQEQQSQRQITLNQARQDLLRNLAGVSQGDRRAALETTAGIAAETGVAQKFIFQAAASAVSASGGAVDPALAAVRQSARFLADRPEAIAGFAGSLLDLSKVTGTTDALVNQGLLTQVGALSRVVDPQAQAQNIPRSLIGQQAFGSTGQGAAALFAALTTGSGDIRGATSGPAALALAEQLRRFGTIEDLDEFATDRQRQEKEEERRLKAPLQGLTTTQQRIAALQADPDLAQAFLGQASFEKVALGPIEQLLLNTSSQVAQEFAKNLRAIPGNAELAALARQSIAGRRDDPLEGVATIARGFDTFLEEADISATGAGRTGAIRSQLEATFQRLNLPATERFARRARFETFVGPLGVDPATAGADVLQTLAGDLENNPLGVTSTLQRFGFGGFPRADLADELRELVAQLRENAQLQREANNATRDNTQTTRAATEGGPAGLVAPPLNTQGE